MAKTMKDTFDDFACAAMQALITNDAPFRDMADVAYLAHLHAARMMAENVRWAETSNLASPFERLSDEP
jgi:hypothetical protein